MDAAREHLHFLQTYPCLSSLNKELYIKLLMRSVLVGVSIVAILFRSFCVYDKSSLNWSRLSTSGAITLLVIVTEKRASPTDLQAPIIICNCGKVKRKTSLFTGIYGSLYLTCHTSQGSIALNSLLIGKSWLCSD